jgi:hypothetical protein
MMSQQVPQQLFRGVGLYDNSTANPKDDVPLLFTCDKIEDAINFAKYEPKILLCYEVCESNLRVPIIDSNELTPTRDEDVITAKQHMHGWYRKAFSATQGIPFGEYVVRPVDVKLVATYKKEYVNIEMVQNVHNKFCHCGQSGIIKKGQEIRCINHPFLCSTCKKIVHVNEYLDDELSRCMQCLKIGKVGDDNICLFSKQTCYLLKKIND